MTDLQSTCNGCTGCAMRCTDQVKLSIDEYARIVKTLQTIDPVEALRVLRQRKELPWFEEITYTACLFLDVNTHLCLVYSARPLICRLFGLMRHLPCPRERVTATYPNGEALLSAYSSQPLMTFQHWMIAHDIFDFNTLFAQTQRDASDSALDDPVCRPY